MVRQEVAQRGHNGANPVRNTPSKMPAPPIDTTGDPGGIIGRPERIRPGHSTTRRPGTKVCPVSAGGSGQVCWRFEGGERAVSALVRPGWSRRAAQAAESYRLDCRAEGPGVHSFLRAAVNVQTGNMDADEGRAAVAAQPWSGM